VRKTLHKIFDEAYQKLRRLAMDKNLKPAELAQRILDVADLLGWSSTPHFGVDMHKNGALNPRHTTKNTQAIQSAPENSDP
jgi:hypothetical protein